MIAITLGVLTTTAQHIQGRAVREYVGIVSGEVLIVTNRERTRATGKQVGVPTLALQGARLRALRMMAQRASDHGATVVIGVDIDCVAVGIGKLLVTASGTAARL